MRLAIIGPATSAGGFNPRICKRCDKALDFDRIYIRGFNPRICKRCDLAIMLIPFLIWMFQSTHL